MATVHLKTVEEPSLIGQLPNTPSPLPASTGAVEAESDSTQSVASGLSTVSTASAAVTKEGHRFRALPGKARRAAVIVPIIFTLMVLPLLIQKFALIAVNAEALVLPTIFLLGGGLALLSGYLLRSKRLGSLSGLLTGMGIFVDLTIGACQSILTMCPPGRRLAFITSIWSSGDDFLLVLALLVIGPLLGLVGALVRKHAQKYKRRLGRHGGESARAGLEA